MTGPTREPLPVPVPKEALDYLRAKGYRVGFDHRDVFQEEHATAWTVAKAMRLDILEAIRAAVDEAIEGGMTFAAFKRDLQPLLEKLGWWGRGELLDPLTGETREVQLGSPRRLKTIYDVNLRQAHAAGQWERIERTTKTHPYLLYSLGPSREHRPEHVGWAGILLRADDPWWETHFPPNGWGCKCWVRQVSRREAERLFATGQYLSLAPELGEQEYVNQRTGQVVSVPKGVEPGWAYNPGKVSRLARAQQLLEEKEAVIPAER
ncbi:phage head morphogenesis protein [Ectopseudomonas chengduensis]